MILESLDGRLLQLILVQGDLLLLEKINSCFSF